MIYRAIGAMSGSSLDGLDLVMAKLEERAGHWSYSMEYARCIDFGSGWKKKLQTASGLNAQSYLELHREFGVYIGTCVLEFIRESGLDHQVSLVCSHGHTTFHLPARGISAQIGDGAAIASLTGLPVITDLRSLDIALGGQGAPIVPLGEQLLFPGFRYFLNLGGIANISFHGGSSPIGFDVCPANGVLNLLACREGRNFDEGGKLAEEGALNSILLHELEGLEYYRKAPPKSLSNEFGTQGILPILDRYPISNRDKLRTYVEHIASRLTHALGELKELKPEKSPEIPVSRLFTTGGGAFNSFLMERIRTQLRGLGLEPVIAEPGTVKFKEALVMALLGTLRWREEFTTLASVTGASRDSIGGALWMGHP